MEIMWWNIAAGGALKQRNSRSVIVPLGEVRKSRKELKERNRNSALDEAQKQ
jgi:hypothetical protein